MSVMGTDGNGLLNAPIQGAMSGPICQALTDIKIGAGGGLLGVVTLGEMKGFLGDLDSTIMGGVNPIAAPLPGAGSLLNIKTGLGGQGAGG